MKPAIAVPLTLCALGLAACGGGDGDKTLDKAALTKAANAICVDYTGRLKKLNAPQGADVSDPAKAATFFASAAKLSTQQSDELRALKAADAVRADYEALVSELDKGTKLLDDLATAAKEKDATKGAKLIAQIDTVDKSVNAAAAKVGANDCGSNS